jgi:hypothetical protein
VGESIWFKAYIIDSLNNKLAHKSKILFVDLVDEKDSLLTQLLLLAGRLKTDGASGSATLYLKDIIIGCVPIPGK